MVTQTTPLTREAGVDLLIQQANVPPKQRSHSYDDDIGILWYVGEQIVLLELEPGDTQGRWLSWHPSEHPNIKNTFQYLDVTNPETWSDLLKEIQNWTTTDTNSPSQEVEAMTTATLPLPRQSGVELLIQKAPLTPYERNHSYDDEFDVEWRIGERIIQVSLETGKTQARWLSWRKSEYPDIKNPFQYLDITNPETWSDLLSELQCQTRTRNTTA